MAENWFSIANMAALVGWLLLLASPFIPRLADLYAALVAPCLFAAAYVALILVYFSSSQGAFSTLAGVARVFEVPELLLAGWLHYLAFDLFVGAWIVRTARKENISFPLIFPCLFFTFLFGPVGYLLFTGLRVARGNRLWAAEPGVSR
ncbi:MAG: ABA4-like family protein [Pseudomonadota bacterium]